MDEQLAVLSIESRGLWLIVHGDKYFLSFTDFPWLSSASVAAVFNIEPFGRNGLRWPDLDVNLQMNCIQHTELYPQISQYEPVDQAVMDAAIALHDGDTGRALQWLLRPARALGGVRPIDHLDSPEHLQAVLDLIGRIEHGVVS